MDLGTVFGEVLNFAWSEAQPPAAACPPAAAVAAPGIGKLLEVPALSATGASLATGCPRHRDLAEPEGD